MKFTPKEDFKIGYTTFEASNTYDAEKQGLTETDLRIAHGAGWTEVEGWDEAPERQVKNPVVITPDSIKVGVASEVKSG